MKRYEHLYFDLDNTLWDFDTNSKLALFQTLNDYNINDNTISHEDFYSYYKIINESLWDAYRKKEVTKQQLIKERFKKSLDYFEIKGIDPVNMNDSYLLNMSDQTVLIDDVFETLDYLKSKKYRMHIITNGFKEVQNLKLEKSGLRKYFDRVFTSEETQTPKPDKRIFQQALKSCNAKKEKSLMIGDSWDTDIIGAGKFGIDQVFFQHNHKNKIPSGLKKTSNTTNTYLIELQNSCKTFSITRLCSLFEIL